MEVYCNASAETFESLLKTCFVKLFPDWTIVFVTKGKKEVTFSVLSNSSIDLHHCIYCCHL